MALAMIFPSSAVAQGFDPTSALSHDAPIGVLTSPDGTRYFIQGEVMDMNSPQSRNCTDDGANSITYRYDVVMPQAAGNLEGDPQVDPSASLKAYLTVYWQEKNVESFTSVLLTHTSVRWTVTDKVVVDSAAIYAEGKGSGLVGYDSTVYETKTFRGVTSGTKYATKFTQYVQRGGLFPMVGSNAIFELSHGTSSHWTFTTAILEVPT